MHRTPFPNRKGRDGRRQAPNPAGRMIYMDAGESVDQGPTEDLIRKPQNEGLKRFLGAMSTP